VKENSRRTTQTTTIAPITVPELREAEKEIVKHVQQGAFSEEISVLTKNKRKGSNCKVIKKSSSIYQLDPAVKNGLLCVGRLRRAQISEEAKHPSILPKTHHVVTLIVNYYHHVLGHSGMEHTLSLIRERYWIVNGRSTVKNIIGKCYSCRKRQSPVSQQKTSLDTESFINALRHFIARRGQPEEIRSDNGGNFVKGEKELKQAVNDWNQTHIHEALPQQNVKWIFNPPAGSHHGGV
jgi:hypothetical protein